MGQGDHRAVARLLPWGWWGAGRGLCIRRVLRDSPIGSSSISQPYGDELLQPSEVSNTL
jgi:hypothetical protein